MSQARPATSSPTSFAMAGMATTTAVTSNRIRKLLRPRASVVRSDRCCPMTSLDARSARDSLSLDCATGLPGAVCSRGKCRSSSGGIRTPTGVQALPAARSRWKASRSSSGAGLPSDGQDRVRLAAMVGLVVEPVIERRHQRLDEFVRRGDAAVAEVAG